MVIKYSIIIQKWYKMPPLTISWQKSLEWEQDAPTGDYTITMHH
ncbi:MAG: hypothetical protein SWX82_17255 [Cyanobacteriota bacterium]|nr:hypothetical protein [Cyanobacteriota bacterium]